MRVPPPGGLCTSSEPSSAATRSPSPGRPRAGERVGAALPVVLDDDHDAAVALAHAHRRARRLGVLRDVRQGFRDDVVGGDRDVRVERRVRDVELDRDRRAGDHDPQRSRKATLRQRGRMDALRERAELLHRLGELLDRHVHRLRLVDEPALRSPQLQQQRQQPLLRSVVEVSLEPAPGVVGGGDDPGTRPANLGLVTLALRHVRAADQVDRAARDLGQRACRSRRRRSRSRRAGASAPRTRSRRATGSPRGCSHGRGRARRPRRTSPRTGRPRSRAARSRAPARRRGSRRTAARGRRRRRGRSGSARSSRSRSGARARAPAPRHARGGRPASSARACP